MELTITGATGTVINAVIAGTDVAAVAAEIQISTSPRFMWVLSPILTVPGDGAQAIAGINQATRYFLRARSAFGNGRRSAWSPTAAIFTPLAQARVTTPAAVMIEPALIVPPEAVLAWSASSEVAGYPARALGRDDPNSTWIAKKAGGLVSFDALTAGAPIDTIAVLETTAGEDCTILVRAAATQAGLADPGAVVAVEQPFRASANLPGRRGYHALVRLAAAVAAPWWRVEIRGSMPIDTFVATYAVFGLAHQTKNIAVDSKSETLIDSGSLDRDRSGNPSRVDGFRGRSVDFEIQQMTEAQYETQFERIRWLVGATDPVLVVPNSKRGAFLHDRILYGQMKPGRATNQSSPRFSQEFSVSSLI